MALAILSLLITAFYTIVKVNSETDPCNTLAQNFFDGDIVQTSQALACLKSFPYNATLAKAITETLYKTYDLHVYKDISKDSPTPEFPMKVDVLAGITKIASTVYDSDYEMNYALYNLINSLNDGHAVYAPYCYYAYMVSYTAFPLVSLYEGGTEVIRISPDIALFAGTIQSTTEALLGISVATYAGAKVNSINGENAVDFAVKFASTQGTYKDLNARYNTAFSRYAGVTSLYYGGLTALPLIAAPQVDNITFVVTRQGSTTPETLVVPYLIAWEGESFTSSTDYWTTYCAEPSPLSVSAKAKANSKVKNKINHVIGKMPHKDTHHRKIEVNKGKKAQLGSIQTGKDGSIEFMSSKKKADTKLPLPDTTVQILVNGYVSTYFLEDLKTGVVVIPDFEGSNADYVSWQADVFNGITQLLSVGAENLILDVQDNGGGYAYLSYILLEFLFPGIGTPQYPIQNPGTPLIQRLVTRSNELMEQTKYWLSNPSQYNWAFDTTPYPDVEMFTSSSEYFFPLVNLTFGGTAGNYSTPYSFPDRLAAPLGIDGLLLPVADTTPLFDPSKVLILSNGGCYSTCSLFAYAAQELAKVKIVTVGGISGLPMAYSAGTAGYSYTLDYLLEYDLTYLGFDEDEDAPKVLPTVAVVGYTAAQAYCRDNATTPADFVFKAADYRLTYSLESVVTIWSLYAEVAALF